MFFFAPNHYTELCEIMARHGSDKGGYRGIGQHNYTPYYHRLFSGIRHTASAVFEFGIGSTSADIRHTMGPNGTPGASLRGWREYFPNANIYSADIDKSILSPEYRIFKFFCDQTNGSSIANLWQTPELKDKLFDVIIEDGLHVFEAQTLFMEMSLSKVKPGGIYVCEDVPDADFPRWENTLRSLAAKSPGKTFQMVKIDNPRNKWNSLIVVR